MRSDFFIKSQSDEDEENERMFYSDSDIDIDDQSQATEDKLFNNMQIEVDNKCEEKHKKRKKVQEQSLIDRDVSRCSKCPRVFNGTLKTRCVIIFLSLLYLTYDILLFLFLSSGIPRFDGSKRKKEE
jgi:hypothetical protein